MTDWKWGRWPPPTWWTPSKRWADAPVVPAPPPCWRSTRSNSSWSSSGPAKRRTCCRPCESCTPRRGSGRTGTKSLPKRCSSFAPKRWPNRKWPPVWGKRWPTRLADRPPAVSLLVVVGLWQILTNNRSPRHNRWLPLWRWSSSGPRF